MRAFSAISRTLASSAHRKRTNSELGMCEQTDRGAGCNATRKLFGDAAENGPLKAALSQLASSSARAQRMLCASETGR